MTDIYLNIVSSVKNKDKNSEKRLEAHLLFLNHCEILDVGHGVLTVDRTLCIKMINVSVRRNMERLSQTYLSLSKTQTQLKSLFCNKLSDLHIRMLSEQLSFIFVVLACNQQWLTQH